MLQLVLSSAEVSNSQASSCFNLCDSSQAFLPWQLCLQVSACLGSLLGKQDKEELVLHSSRLS